MKLNVTIGIGLSIAMAVIMPPVAFGAAHITVDENTGVQQVSSDGTAIDSKTMVGAICLMYPHGKEVTATPVVEIHFINDKKSPKFERRRPEWRKIKGVAKIYTPYRMMEGRLEYIKGAKEDYLRLVMRASDFVHMTRCQKARIAYGKVGFNLRAHNLAELANVSQVITGGGEQIAMEQKNEPRSTKTQQIQSASAMSVSRNEEGETILTFNLPTVEDGEETHIKSQFTLPAGKGLLGPSSNPSDQKGFWNQEKTVFAVNNQPVTKSSYVYIFLKKETGSIQMIDNVNKKVAKLLPSEQSDLALDFLRVEKIVGRDIYVQTVDFYTDGRPTYNYRITVNEDGSIKVK